MSIKIIQDIHECPLCGNPVCEAPRGSGDLACIRGNCPYMTHYNWTKEDYQRMEEEE